MGSVEGSSLNHCQEGTIVTVVLIWPEQPCWGHLLHLLHLLPGGLLQFEVWTLNATLALLQSRHAAAISSQNANQQQNLHEHKLKGG